MMLYCCSCCLVDRRISRYSIDPLTNKPLDYCKKCIKSGEYIPYEEYKKRKYGNGNQAEKSSKRLANEFEKKIDGRKCKPKMSKEMANLIRRAYVIKRLKEDVEFRLANNLRSRVSALLRGKNKSAATFELIGCNVKFFKEHITNQFKPGMSWSNYGEWEIDHIKPCSKFDLTLPEQQKACFNYMNTQPLWRFENRSKNNRYLE